MGSMLVEARSLDRNISGISDFVFNEVLMLKKLNEQSHGGVSVAAW